MIIPTTLFYSMVRLFHSSDSFSTRSLRAFLFFSIFVSVTACDFVQHLHGEYGVYSIAASNTIYFLLLSSLNLKQTPQSHQMGNKTTEIHAFWYAHTHIYHSIGSGLVVDAHTTIIFETRIFTTTQPGTRGKKRKEKKKLLFQFFEVKDFKNIPRVSGFSFLIFSFHQLFVIRFFASSL